MDEIELIARFLEQGSAVGTLAVLFFLFKSVTKAVSNDIAHIHEELKGLREDIRGLRDEMRFALMKK